MSRARWCKDSSHVEEIKNCEARLEAAIAENQKLREENARLRQLVRPPLVHVGNDDAGEFTYTPSDPW